MSDMIPVPLWVAGRVSDNRIAVEAVLSGSALPAPSVVPCPDMVHVTVADPDDLAIWLYELGGTVHRQPPHEGVALWTLRTHTPTRADGTAVAIAVHALVIDGASVLHEIERAVAS